MMAAPIIAAALAFAGVIAAGGSKQRRLRGRVPSSSIDMAGLRSAQERRSFRALHACITVSAAMTAGAAAALADVPAATCVVALLAGGTAGWSLPRAWIRARAARLRREICAELPIMLDLLQISLRGGLGLPAAWSSVAASVQDGAEALAAEMRRIDLEVSFGKSWSASLADAADRTGVGELRSLGSLMAQAERFGSELASTLEVMSDSLRHEEMQAFEERAHQASVKLLFPLAAFLLPATLLLIVAPLLLLLFQALLRATT